MDKGIDADKILKSDFSVTNITSVYKQRIHSCDSGVKTYRNNALLYVAEGSVEFAVENVRYKAGKNSVLKFSDNIDCCVCASDCELYVAEFNVINTAEFEKIPFPNAYVPSNNRFIRQKYEALIERYNKRNAAYLLSCKSLLYEIVSGILIDCFQSCYNEKDLIYSMDISEYINNNFKNPSLSVAVICKEFGISDSYIRKCLKDTTNMSPIEYIHYVRLNYAGGLLRQKNLSIGEVTYKYVFTSLYYFSRIFKKKMGITPSEYRERYIR